MTTLGSEGPKETGTTVSLEGDAVFRPCCFDNQRGPISMIATIQKLVRTVDGAIACAYLSLFRERGGLRAFLFHSLFRDEREIALNQVDPLQPRPSRSSAGSSNTTWPTAIGSWAPTTCSAACPPTASMP